MDSRVCKRESRSNRAGTYSEYFGLLQQRGNSFLHNRLPGHLVRHPARKLYFDWVDQGCELEYLRAHSIQDTALGKGSAVGLTHSAIPSYDVVPFCNVKS